jgi:hypothetical protein
MIFKHDFHFEEFWPSLRVFENPIVILVQNSDFFIPQYLTQVKVSG